MSDTWEIVPLRAVGPIRLGMSEAEIEALSGLLGERYAMDRKDLPSGDVVYRESRDLEAPLITYRDGRVVEIMVDHHSRFDVTYRGLSVFATPARDLLRELERQDGRAFWGFGAVVFPALSVGTSNFVVAVADDGAKLWWEESPEKPPRSLTLAERGAYDPFLAAHYRQVTFA